MILALIFDELFNDFLSSPIPLETGQKWVLIACLTIYLSDSHSVRSLHSPPQTASPCPELELGPKVSPSLSSHLMSSPEGCAVHTLVNLLVIHQRVFLASHLKSLVRLILFLTSRKPHFFLDAELSSGSSLWPWYQPGFGICIASLLLNNICDLFLELCLLYPFCCQCGWISFQVCMTITPSICD